MIAVEVLTTYSGKLSTRRDVAFQVRKREGLTLIPAQIRTGPLYH